MKLLAISEHYYPRVGGTVNYVHETLCALTAAGVTAEILVPGPEPLNWLPAGMPPPPYRVTWIDAGYPPSGDPGREHRYSFCRKVEEVVRARMSTSERPDLLHVLFGLFIMEMLDTGALRRAGLPSIATVHNVPPMECRLTAPTAPMAARVKEELRLRLVSIKNQRRLRRHRYDLYVVPSEQVSTLLQPIVGEPVAVIGHGPTSDLQALMSPPESRIPKGPVRLLTAGGYAPHKRQHIIPATAQRLCASGLEYIWDVVGPSGRVKGYHDAIVSDVETRRLQSRVVLHHAVSLSDLAGLYDRAHLYIQPSTEEGFCLTALDAAAAGIPVIGSPAGALPDITTASGGRLVPSAPEPLAEAIVNFYTQRRWSVSGNTTQLVRDRFSWSEAAQQLLQHYTRIRHSGTAQPDRGAN